jgi:hypothetical protein
MVVDVDLHCIIPSWFIVVYKGCLIVVSVRNSLGTRAGRLVWSNQSISASFDCNSERMFSVSEVEVVNISSRKRNLPVIH